MRHTYIEKGDEDDDEDGEDDDSTTLTEASRADKSAKAESDLMFPDEVDCPLDTPARLRFQKYLFFPLLSPLSLSCICYSCGLDY